MSNSKTRKYRHLTDQRDEYLNETYEFLCQKVIDEYKDGAMLMHHKQSKKMFGAFEKGDFNQEIIEQIGGLPKRKLSRKQFTKKVSKRMQEEGYKRFVFGLTMT